MRDAPERIWTWDADGGAWRLGMWDLEDQSGDVEYVRADLVAKVRADALREAAAEIVQVRRDLAVAILALIDKDAAA